jgi:anti-sigma regulatory factor (Ser/Thr protein kinase)
MGSRRTNPSTPPATMELGSLSALADALAKGSDPHQALLDLVSVVRAELVVDRVGVFMLDRVTQRLERMVGIAADGMPEFEGEEFSVDGERMPLSVVARRELPYYLSDDAPAEFPEHQFQPGVRAVAVFPIIAGGELQGALCADNAFSGQPLSPALLPSFKVYASLAALPLFALHQKREAERVEAMRRKIYRQVLLAVTGGKFHLCEEKELAEEWPGLEAPIQIREDRDIGVVREAVRRAAQQAGLSEERTADFTLSVCEAATNALLHGKGGIATVAHDQDRLRFRIQDHGEGIEPEDIPKATLVKGWSKRASLGLGFTIINEMADRVFMSTGPEGTSLVLEMDLVAPAIYGLGPELGRWADAFN